MCLIYFVYVQVFNFQQFCMDTYCFILETWTWISIPETMHRMLAHTTEVIMRNGNRGFKKLAEQGGESQHWNQRMTRETGARKVSLMLGDTDTLRRGCWLGLQLSCPQSTGQAALLL